MDVEENAEAGRVVAEVVVADADAGPDVDAADFVHRLTGAGAEHFQLKQNPEVTPSQLCPNDARKEMRVCRGRT